MLDPSLSWRWETEARRSSWRHDDALPQRSPPGQGWLPVERGVTTFGGRLMGSRNSVTAFCTFQANDFARSEPLTRKDTFCNSLLLDLALFEGSYVLCSQLKPFTISSPISEPTMPIRLDTRRIIGTDSMEQIGLVRKCNTYLFEASFGIIAASNFKMLARLDEIYVAIDCFR